MLCSMKHKFHLLIHENMKFYHQLSDQTTAFEYNSPSVRLLLLRAHELSWLLKFLILQEKLHFVTLLFLTGPAGFKLWTRVTSSGQLVKKQFILIFLLTAAVGLSKKGSRCLDAVTSAVITSFEHLCPVRPTCPKSDFYSNIIKED